MHWDISLQNIQILVLLTYKVDRSEIQMDRRSRKATSWRLSRLLGGQSLFNDFDISVTELAK